MNQDSERNIWGEYKSVLQDQFHLNTVQICTVHNSNKSEEQVNAQASIQNRKTQHWNVTRNSPIIFSLIQGYKIWYENVKPNLDYHCAKFCLDSA